MSLRTKRVDFDETWGLLQETVKGILSFAKVSKSTWHDRFSDIYSLCVAFPVPLSAKLYIETKILLENHVQKLLDKVLEDGDLILLKSYNEAWTQYYQGINYLNKFYTYLNVQHLKKKNFPENDIIYGNLPPEAENQMEIGELGFEIWKANMLGPLQQKLVDQILLGIYQDRVGASGQFSPAIIHGVIESFVLVQDYKKPDDHLDLYEEIFEEPFLKASGEYFQQESNRLFSVCNVTQYIEKTNHLLNEENLRSTKFLHSSSYEKARAKCEQYMVSAHLDVLHEESQQMVSQERLRELTLLYNLVENVPDGLPPLIEQVLNHIKKKGLEALPNNSSTIGPVVPASTHSKKTSLPYTEFVESMLAIHIKYNQMIQQVFKGNKHFIGAFDKAYAFVMNHNTNPKIECTTPEMFALYYDKLLKKSTKGLSESEIEEKLSKSIRIFDYIADKDMFITFYARKLTIRLIYQQTNSLDEEEAMITRLKVAYGYAFTYKLTQMFTDISLSADLNNNFNNCMRNGNIELGMNFSSHILKAGAWPIGQSATTPFVVPQELERSLQLFENFYKKQFNGRKLTWLPHLSEGELKLTYLKRPYLITMQTFQMAILLLLEKTNSLTCKELQETLQLNDDVFAKHAASLVDCKLLISNTPNILSETVLSLNMKYNNKRTKIKISNSLQRESPQEIKQSMVRIDDDRKLLLNAAIVRIMKCRQTLKHNELIQQVLSQANVSFAPSITMIKKCIEVLIDKEYIDRTPNSTDEYIYIA